MKFALALLAAATILPAAPARAASFDCTKASTRIDKTICADPALGRLDADIAAAYAAAGAGLDDAMRARLKRSQREWLDHREPGRDALRTQMTARLGLLRAPSRNVAGVAFLELADDRSRPMFMSGPEPGAAAYNRWADAQWEQDSGDLTLAEADREQARCDAAAKANAKPKSEGDDECIVEGVRHVFTTVVLPPGILSVGDSVERDQHAAHPMDELHHANWWLRRGGRIGVADTFAGDGWKAVIARTVRGGVKERCGDVVPSQDAIASVLDPDTWGFASDGLQLTGDGYDFGCGRGPVEVTVAWRELRAAMRPEFAAALGLR